MQYLVREHEPRVKNDSTSLIQVSVHNACAEAVAHRHDQHGLFVGPEMLAADDCFCVRNQVAMTDHHQSRHAGGARGGHQGCQIIFFTACRLEEMDGTRDKSTLDLRKAILSCPVPANS